MNPKVSIIVPVHNATLSIHNCINSILDQTDNNFELILINDGSTDDSGKICDRYSFKDSRIIVKHKTNGGVSTARNLGLDIAKGEYIMFVDSDDWIENDSLEIIKHYLADEDNDVIIFSLIKSLLSDNKVIKSELNGLYKESKLTTNELANNFIFYLNSVGMQPSWMYVFKANIITKHKLRFNQNSVLYEDFDFNLRYLKYCNNIKFIPDALYHYQIPVSVNQLAKRNKVNIVPDISTVCNSLLDFLHSHGANDEIIRQIYVYILPMYSLCLKNIVIHRKDTKLKVKFEVIKQLYDDKIFKLIIADYGDTLWFYRTLNILVKKQLYLLAYYLLLYRFNNEKAQ